MSNDKQFHRSSQYKVTKDLSNLSVKPAPPAAATAPSPIKTKTNASPVVTVVIKYDVPHIVLPDIPVLESPYDQVNTISKVKAFLAQSQAVTSSLSEFYNLNITRDHIASYAIVIPSNGVHERHRLNDQPFSYSQVIRVDVIFDVTKSIVRCKQYRHADDVNAETISDFETGAAYGKYNDEIKELKGENARLQRFLAEKNARAGDEGTRAAADAATIKYQRERLLKYFKSEEEKDKKLTKLEEENKELKARVQALEAALESTGPVGYAPTGSGRVTRSGSRRTSGV